MMWEILDWKSLCSKFSHMESRIQRAFSTIQRKEAELAKQVQPRLTLLLYFPSFIICFPSCWYRRSPASSSIIHQFMFTSSLPFVISLSCPLVYSCLIKESGLWLTPSFSSNFPYLFVISLAFLSWFCSIPPFYKGFQGQYIGSVFSLLF